MYSKDGGATWQISNVFNGLASNTEYQFAIKLRGTIDLFESEVSDITKVKTPASYTLSFKDLGFNATTTAASGSASFSTTQYKESGVATALTTSRTLVAGDKISFTDMHNNVFNYEVIWSEVIDRDAVNDLRAGDWDLTLFTCTPGGSNRVTVRCVRINQ